MIEALLREREGYVARGLHDRVAMVDEQLRILGYNPRSSGGLETKIVEPPEVAVPEAPKPFKKTPRRPPEKLRRRG